MDQKEILFALFRQELTDAPCSFKKEEVTSQMLLKLYESAKAQDLTHIVGEALEKAGLLSIDPVIEQKFSKQQMLALYRYERLNFEYTRICALFEEEGILYVPLKGAVLRQYYPKPFMRTSCDIDILVKEEALEKAVSLLCEKLNYKTEGGKTFHDFHLFSPGGVHLELHHNLREEIEPMDSVLLKVWDHVYCPQGHRFCRMQTPEFLYFHQIAHAAYHFIKGGCGIRPIMDLYLLKQKLPYDSEKLEKLLEEASLSTFASKLFALSEVWFGGKKHDKLTLEMEEYILGAGIYGSVENSVAMGRAVKGSRTSYILGHIFMPYKNLKDRYPILKKCPLLFPFVSVYRWFYILFGKYRKLAFSIFKSNINLDSEKQKRLDALRSNLKLK